MTKGFSETEGNALNSTVIGIIERALASLMVIGMEREGALNLLIIQSAIRKQDKNDLHRLLKQIEGDFTGDDDEEPA